MYRRLSRLDLLTRRIKGTFPNKSSLAARFVSLGSTNKKNQGHLPEQVVARRKFRFQAIKNESSNKLLSDDNLMPFRKNMYQALRFRLEACILIGSGLRRENHELVMDDYDFTTRSACTSVCSRGRLFADKRKLLNAHLSTALL